MVSHMTNFKHYKKMKPHCVQLLVQSVIHMYCVWKMWASAAQ